MLLEHPDAGAITGRSLGALLYLGAFASVAGFLVVVAAESVLLRHGFARVLEAQGTRSRRGR